MKALLVVYAFACSPALLVAANAPLPSFQEKGGALPPLSLNEAMKDGVKRGATPAKPLQFAPQGVPRFADGIGPDNPLLREFTPPPSATVPPPVTAPTPRPAVAQRVPNRYGSRMPIITPSDSVDYKMRIVPPDPSIDFKILAIETGPPDQPSEKK